LTQIEVDSGAFETYDVEPPAIPDVLAERPVVVFGKWRGQPQGQITLHGMAADGPYTATVEVGDVTPLETNAALRYLWARHRAALRSDYNQVRGSDALVEEITSLGLTCNLLTAYTSFIAIDPVRSGGACCLAVQAVGVSDFWHRYQISEDVRAQTGPRGCLSRGPCSCFW
jgi:Ca-activated chloride channel family protein